MKKNLKLVFVLFVAFSLAGITVPMSGNFRLPVVQLAHANQQVCETRGASGVCSEFWYPAGPGMNTLLATIFTDENTEYTNLQSATPSIDFTDSPCSGTPTTGACGSLTTNPNFVVTAPVPGTGYDEIEFHLDSVFWNCNFGFGNSACGIEIRQGIAHMFDRVSFCTNSVIAGTCTPLDVPVPTSNGGGLPSPNPCAYDTRFAQSGTNCVVGSPGGTAYHLAASTGADGFQWLYAPGSTDLNAADTHLVAAGVATGFSTSTSILTAPVTGNTPTFFIRNDNTPRRQLGESLAAQICYVFTGTYTQPCSPYLNTVEGPITAFPGFTTSKTSVNISWSMYTAGFSGSSFFDGSLYFGYNSHFVSGIASIQTPTGPCDSTSVPTASARDYQYACVQNFDSLSTQMESAPCLAASGDPAIGAVSNSPTAPGNGVCPGTTQLSGISAGIQAEAAFGGNELTIPGWEVTFQFAYRNGWLRAINSPSLGLPNDFTWLNAWNPSPQVPGTLRQGFSQSTRSVNPYIASTPQDRYVVDSVYDPLTRPDPLSPTQIFNWLVLDAAPENNTTVMSQSGYTPPSGTLVTYHFTLLSGFVQPYFQDSRPVTAYDVAFSYLSMVGSGAFLGTGASTTTGITVLTINAFDIGVSSRGPFTLPNLGSIPILPARYWTGVGPSAWDSAIRACQMASCPKAQYSLSGTNVVCPTAGGQPGCASFAASNMQVDPTKLTATFDPIASHTFVGSGPFECGTVTSTGSGTCTSTGVMNPAAGGSYTLTRFGNGLAPASSTSGIYFRSSGKLALYIWSEEGDVSPILPLSAIFLCFNQPVNLNGGCAHWQKGIGRDPTGVVGINQLSILLYLFNTSWVRPFSVASLPLGMAKFTPAPVLYEGVTLNPCSIDPINGYDC